MGKDVKSIQECVELAQEKVVCRNCTGKRHFTEVCPLNKNGASRVLVNSIPLIPDSDSEIQHDVDLLVFH